MVRGGDWYRRQWGEWYSEHQGCQDQCNELKWKTRETIQGDTQRERWEIVWGPLEEGRKPCTIAHALAQIDVELARLLDYVRAGDLIANFKFNECGGNEKFPNFQDLIHSEEQVQAPPDNLRESCSTRTGCFNKSERQAGHDVRWRWGRRWSCWGRVSLTLSDRHLNL